MSGRQAKKIRRLVRSTYPILYSNLEKAIMNLPFRKRLKIALRILFKRNKKENVSSS
jgi:hypothetical protein